MAAFLTPIRVNDLVKVDGDLVGRVVNVIQPLNTFNIYVVNTEIGIGIANPIRTDGRRATWKTGQNKQELELHQYIVSKYEERQQNMSGEITELRDCLISTEHELLSVLNQSDNLFHLPSPQNIPFDVSILIDDDAGGTSSQVNSTFCVDNLQSIDENCKPVINHKDIERRIKKTCNLLKKIISQQNGASNCTPGMDKSIQQPVPRAILQSGSACSERDWWSGEREKLCSQLEHYKEIIKQQEQLIQQSIWTQSQSVENILSEKENLAEEKRHFLQEKVNFDEEKRKFVEVAFKLGKEKQTLQEERVELFVEQCKNLHPSFTASEDHGFESSHQGSSHRVRMLPVTPIFSPSHKIDTSSTAELYKSFGITPYQSSSVKKLCKVLSAESTSTSKRSSISSQHSSSSALNTSSSALQMDAMKRALFQKASKITGQCDILDNGS